MDKGILAIALAAVALPLAGATDPPELKEGLWSIQTQSTEKPSGKKSEGTYTLCRDHAFDQSTRTRAKAMKGCTTVNESFRDGKYTSEVRCTAGKIVIESKGTTTFQGDTASHSETEASYTPALGGVSGNSVVMDQKYVGACPAGTQPGDRTNPDGTVIHLGQQ